MSGDACGTDASAPPVLPLESAPAGLRARLESLRLKYAAAFGGEVPAVYVRVPGRVNLIGEHVDYCGYSVCPMAIQQDLLVAASPVDTGDFLRLVNLDSETYPGHDFPDRNFVIDLKLNGWSSYFLCGVKGALERMSTGCSLPNGRPNGDVGRRDNEEVGDGKRPVRMRVAVSGNVPPGSGLSSSSALVSAAFLTTAYLNKMQLSKSELAALSARSEQYIGTVGGGMDQAIAFLATKARKWYCDHPQSLRLKMGYKHQNMFYKNKKQETTEIGCAKHIEFEPIRTEDLSLPDDAVFVIAHSRVTKNKAATADFNTRVVECRLAAQMLGKRRGMNWKRLLRLADVQREMGLSLDKMAVLVEVTFHESPYTKREICEALEVSTEELDTISLTPNTVHVDTFKLLQRALHVFQEAWRVDAWCHECRSGAADLTTLGCLMNESHDSLRSLYECSHPTLDRLVRVCTEAGAKGARLTGAGWGGCVVALTTRDTVEEFIEEVKREFYTKVPPGEGFKTVSSPDSLIFPTEPNQGAEIYLP